ncbi:MAG: hypothetical protein ACN6OP_30180 [Pseudomonadales bacterium]
MKEKEARAAGKKKCRSKVTMFEGWVLETMASCPDVFMGGKNAWESRTPE